MVLHYADSAARCNVQEQFARMGQERDGHGRGSGGKSIRMENYGPRCLSIGEPTDPDEDLFRLLVVLVAAIAVPAEEALSLVGMAVEGDVASASFPVRPVPIPPLPLPHPPDPPPPSTAELVEPPS